MDSKSYFSGSLVQCVIILTIACSTITCTTTDGNSKVEVPKIFDYEYFKTKFHKSYSPVSSLRRCSLFLSHTIKIFQHNFLFGQKAFGYYLDQNEFTDFTGQELLSMFGDEESELEPVKEFSINPDAPANSVLSVKRFLGVEEGYSSAALEDLDSKPEDNRRNSQIKPFFTFSDDEEYLDSDSVMKQLKTKPEIADKISKFVDLKSYTSSEEHQVEAADRKSGIKYKPIVSSDNNKYEIQMKPSRATGDEINDWSFTDQKLYDLNIAPYSAPVDLTPVGKSFFSSIFDQVESIGKSVVNFLDPDESVDGVDEEPIDLPKDLPSEPVSKTSATVYKIDWRTSGCISEPRHQKLCNSCYAFATLSMLEYYYCKQNHESTSFSPQYLIDCGSGVELKGCDGGKISNTGLFIKKFGLELESMYPYLARKEQCPFESDSEQQDLDSVGYIKPQITHWQRFDDLAAWYRWIRKGPIVVGINMPSDFFAYGGGVHDGFDCNVEMTHAVLLVGFGTQDGKEFWLLKNSYSPDWGEQGYFKLSASAPVRCFNSVVVARVKFNLKIRDKVKLAASKTSAK